MEIKPLNDQSIYPDEAILRAALGPSFSAYMELIGRLSLEDFGIALEWRYYRDGKSWLGKAVHKKKTVFWLAVLDKSFCVTFYFSETKSEGIMELDIDKGIKEDFRNTPGVGKLRPLTVVIASAAQIADILKIAEYKIIK